MKIRDLLEAVNKAEWRYSADENEAVLFKDHGRGMQYAAVYVHNREDYFEFFHQTATIYSDHMVIGDRNQRAKFTTRQALNAFLKKNGLPAVPEDILDKMREMGEFMFGFADSYGSTKLIKFRQEDIEILKRKSATAQEFVDAITKELQKFVRRKNWAYNVKEMSASSKAAAEEYFLSGSYPKI